MEIEDMFNPTDIDQVWLILQDRLRGPGYRPQYATEAQFEADVWKRTLAVATDLKLDVGPTCLTSHAIHAERSVQAWEQFLEDDRGPDVTALGSKNRLDIVFRHPTHGSVGIEVKCLGHTGHAAKLTQAIGQALLGLWHRDRTIVAIHCGTVEPEVRDQLRQIARKVFHATNTAVVVVP